MTRAVAVLVFVIVLSEGCKYNALKKLESLWCLQKFDVTFELFTRKNPESGVFLSYRDKSKLLGSGFESSLPSVFITHGFLDDANSDWIKAIKREILSVEDVNLITVDWSKCSKKLVYSMAVRCMKSVGLRMGRFLRFLQDDVGVDLGRTHMIGHSLGAHMIAFAARVFPEERTIGRITGLDPAGPLFENVPSSERLSTASAKVVDVLHTCTVFVGMRKPIGTVDFYPNGGFKQLGCHKVDLGCNHAMSETYFARSVSEKTYLGKKCDSLQDALKEKCDGEEALMGYHLRYRSPGIYYVPIN